jgi:hypothetical protein
MVFDSTALLNVPDVSELPELFVPSPLESVPVTSDAEAVDTPTNSNAQRVKHLVTVIVLDICSYVLDD